MEEGIRLEESKTEDMVHTCFIFFFSGQLLLWHPSAAVHQSGSLPVCLPRHHVVFTRQTQVSSYQLPVGLAFLAHPRDSRLDFPGGFERSRPRKNAVRSRIFRVNNRLATAVTPASPHPGLPAAYSRHYHLPHLHPASAAGVQGSAEAEGHHGHPLHGGGFLHLLDALQHHTHCGHHQKQL